jgi:hypothetical protein
MRLGKQNSTIRRFKVVFLGQAVHVAAENGDIG